jgi:hypothetical protein
MTPPAPGAQPSPQSYNESTGWICITKPIGLLFWKQIGFH